MSARIDETKNLAQSVVEIWGDLKAREYRLLKQNVSNLISKQNKMVEADKNKSIKLSILENKVQKLEERLELLEENQNQGFFSKIIKK